MKNTINPLNPYLISYNIWNKQDKSWQEEYTRSMGKANSAREFRTLSLDFGRRTGKTQFALHLLHKNPNNCVIITPTRVMRDCTFRKFCETYQPTRIHRGFRGIINSNGFIEREENFAQYEGYRSIDWTQPTDYDLREVDIIILEEPHMIKSKAIRHIWDNAHDNAKFILLGTPRL